MTQPHERYHDAWRRSVLRSALVLKSMIGQMPLTKAARAGASVRDIVRETNKAVLDCASAEMQARVADGLYDDGQDNVGVTVKREGFPLRAAEIAKKLEGLGFVKTHSEGSSEDVVLFERGAEVVAVDTDGEWMWKDRDQTRAGDRLRDLAELIRQEET